MAQMMYPILYNLNDELVCGVLLKINMTFLDFIFFCISFSLEIMSW